MKLSRTAFAEGGMLPPRFTSHGNSVSPPLEWEDIPDGTQAFALTCEDPDAPTGVFTHWLLYNLPAGTLELGEGIPADEVLSIGARQGRNSFGDVGYGGACPPKGDSDTDIFSSLTPLIPDSQLSQEQVEISCSPRCVITSWPMHKLLVSIRDDRR